MNKDIASVSNLNGKLPFIKLPFNHHLKIKCKWGTSCLTSEVKKNLTTIFLKKWGGNYEYCFVAKKRFVKKQSQCLTSCSWRCKWNGSVFRVSSAAAATFWHPEQKQDFHFLMCKFSNMPLPPFRAYVHIGQIIC